MDTLRLACRISYVFFVLLLIGTVLLYDSLELTQDWLVAVLIPAIAMALASFVVIPIFDWFRSSVEEKQLGQPWYVAYSVVLAFVMLVAPISLASWVLEVPDAVFVTILTVTVLLFVLNSLMLVFVGYFLDDADNP
jgi:hypothetical protein